MDRARWMERLIGMFTGRERAASMVGDLLETSGNGGRFLFPALGVLFSVAWRPVLGVVLAYASIVVAMLPMMRAWAPMARHMMQMKAPTPARSAYEREVVAVLLFGFGATLMSTLAMFALVRYGFRNALARVGVSVAGLSLAWCWYMHAPAVRVVLIVATAVVVGGVLWKSAYREAGLVLCAALAVDFALGMLVGFVTTLHYSSNFVSCALLLIPLAGVLAMAQMHRRWMEKKNALA